MRKKDDERLSATNSASSSLSMMTATMYKILSCNCGNGFLLMLVQWDGVSVL